MAIETTDSHKSTQCWLPPTPLTKSKFNAFVMYVDMKCSLYLQLVDDGMRNIY